ncbi:AtpZ/AtpI family protein [SCandidatus Aminicenantes bacterium Aminicenantia_JdfR_composite]|nr:AtpZ/AtpI family protein [SCandidatus Aminicenantes bacterium Aminicenantia_JdfR_composite]MCP2598665.1 AtpZ/AtpI family protein [Candidatus Aminicenantes bacterium AC-335-L06]MCP2606546.1 AtpZ/AtpI family protein [Candidatus Aminicenantes bacterium AC-708-I09]
MKKKDKNSYRKLAYLSSLGLMLPSSIVVGMVMGWLLDKIFKTWPWLFLIFTLFGIISGFYNIIREVSKFDDN